MRPLSLRNRSGAPIPVDVTLDWAGRGVVEGELEATFRAGHGVTGHYRSAALALTTGRQTFRMLLPAMTVPWEGEQIRASYRFRTSRGTYDLGTRPIIVPAVRQRWLNICVSDPSEERNRWARAAAKALCFDKLKTKTRDGESVRLPPGSRLSVQPVHVPPEDLPEIPLGYCAYDVVLLAGRGFTGLRQRQLKALIRWVEAGGSVCVLPRTDLRPYHVDFLNTLTGEAKAFTWRADGSVAMPAAASAGVPMHLRCGLGRAVVLTVTSEKDTTFDTPAWREAVCFVWKIRRDVRDQLRRLGRISHDDVEHYGVQPVRSTSQLVKGLLPRTARLVPLWLVLCLLAVFVFAVGPGDYLLLGLLRQRRLTWVLFPVLSITLTLFMVFLSERYMGQTDRRTSVVFVDVGKGGKVLRTNRYELIFAARSRDVTTELKHCFFTPLDHRGLDYSSNYYRRYYQTRETGPPRYSGRMPTHYTALQTIRKWTPQLNRIFSLEPPRAALKLNWDALDVSLFKSEEGRRRLAETLIDEKQEFMGSLLLLNTGGGAYRPGIGFSAAQRALHRRDGRYKELWQGFMKIERFIRDASSRKGAKGLFRIVSQISPTMGDNFEDLAVLDPTDPDQWLLAVVTQTGNDTVVYRRLYSGGR